MGAENDLRADHRRQRRIFENAMPGQGSDHPLPPRQGGGQATEGTRGVSMPGLPMLACWNEKAELMTGSLCDKCYAPGACCQEFMLSGTGKEKYGSNKRGARRHLVAKDENPSGKKKPFQPVEYLAHVDMWVWRCPKIGDDGRCKVYERRPETCRIFEPASAGLCVHFGGAEGGSDG